jgi:hypothetical protein
MREARPRPLRSPVIVRSEFPTFSDLEVAGVPLPAMVVNLSSRESAAMAAHGGIFYQHLAIGGAPRPIHRAAIGCRWDRLQGVRFGDVELEYQEYLLSIASACAGVTDHIIDTLQDRDLRSVYVFCDGGKDRTGLTVAMLQRKAGIPLESVVREFSSSNRSLPVADQQVLMAAPESLRALVQQIVGVQGHLLPRILDSCGR